MDLLAGQVELPTISTLERQSTNTSLSTETQSRTALKMPADPQLHPGQLAQSQQPSLSRESAQPPQPKMTHAQLQHARWEGILSHPQEPKKPQLSRALLAQMASQH